MTFQLGDVISICGTEYQVVGAIRFKNLQDACEWDEYRIMSLLSGECVWLSVDDVYQEYSVSEVTFHPNPTGFHEVDRGVAVVTGCAGHVDVECGDRVNFIEYEDASEDRIISQEIWEDETEWSTGYYIEAKNIEFLRHEQNYKAPSLFELTPGGKTKGMLICIVVILGCFVFMSGFSLFIGFFNTTPQIRNYLKQSNEFTYVTSVTGNNNQKAQVYQAKSGTTLNSAALNIIHAIEGSTQYVQQDDSEEDGAIAILTKKEYCIIYISEDSGVFVQVSDRKYAYTTDSDLYKGTRSGSRYYRRFYHSTGYSTDSKTYTNTASPYSSYSDSDISYNGSNTYNSYSNSVRQSSVNSRQSSGGGLSGGK